jgi:hypothetical protein
MVAMPIIGGLIAGAFLYFNQPNVEEAAESPRHSVTIYAEPPVGHVEVSGITAEVGSEVAAPEGLQEFVFVGEGWQTTCEVEVNAGLATIKFYKESGRCFKTFR